MVDFPVRFVIPSGWPTIDAVPLDGEKKNVTAKGPLPVVDANATLQRQSILALQVALPVGDFIFRDERADDYGVDGSLELLTNGNATNVRAQIQLKGRSNTSPNADGAIPIGIATSNLNYLLNGICPIYVLFRPETNELRFAFAREEWDRLERENASWREKATVTIYFRRVLDAESLEEIRQRIAREAGTGREVAERLSRLREGAAHVIVDAKTLEVTDTQQIVEALIQIGHVLTNSGLAKVVVERGSFVPGEMLLREPRAALAVAYAQFHLAQYHEASTSLRRILQVNPPLDLSDKSLLDALFISVRCMLGEFDSEQYDKEMRGWTEGAPADLAVQYEISAAWSNFTKTMTTCFSDADRAVARKPLAEALARGRSLGGSGHHHYIELLELTLSQHDVSDGMLDAEAALNFAERGMGDERAARAEVNRAGEAAARWLERLKSLADSTRATAPRVHCEALLLRGHAVLGQASQRQLKAQTGHGQPLSQREVEAIFLGVDETLQLARALENRELELSALQSQAKALDIIARADEATSVATGALRIAELCGCSIHARQLRNFIKGEDRTESRLRQLREFAGMSEEEMIRNAGDDQLLFMAKAQITANQLPEHRTPNALRSLACHRQLARERRDWCEHIALAEHNGHAQSPRTMFAAPVPLKVVCVQFGHEVRVQAEEPAQVSQALRTRFCDGCSARAPASPASPAAPAAARTGASERGERNRAKAERRRRAGR